MAELIVPEAQLRPTAFDSTAYLELAASFDRDISRAIATLQELSAASPFHETDLRRNLVDLASLKQSVCQEVLSPLASFCMEEEVRLQGLSQSVRRTALGDADIEREARARRIARREAEDEVLVQAAAIARKRETRRQRSGGAA